MSTDAENRKLSALRVVDLKSELEKRGLDKTGNKQALVERLQKALEDEGADPETYEFDGEKKQVKRLSSSSNQLDADTSQKDVSELGEEDTEDTLETNEKMVLDEEKVETVSSNDEKKEPVVSSVEKVVEEEEEEEEEEMPSEKVDKESSKQESGKGEKEEVPEEKQEVVIQTKEPAVKESADLAEPESPIRLTLEEEESLQDEDMDSAMENIKPVSSPSKSNRNHEDTKSTTNKNQEHSGKDMADNDEKTQDIKKQDGNVTTVGASGSKQMLKSKKSNILNRNLWITNISQTIRATELKQALSTYGKVIGAKVVINAKYPGACCYGYVTMDTVQDADNCIAHLNNTELNGQIIRIEKVRPDHMNCVKLNPKLKAADAGKDDRGKSKLSNLTKTSSPAAKSQERKEEDKKEPLKEGEKEKEKKDEKKDSKTDGHKSDTSSGKRRDQKRKSRSIERGRSGSKGHRSRHEKDLLTFDKIKEERERQRIRERDRIMREESRRRREEAVRQREVERLQRSEAARLDREREKLRIEREKLEREKAEIIRLERERQKLEREKLEIEKLELQRAKIRLQEEDRHTVKRSAAYRRDDSFEERKRLPGERRYDVSPPRFDPTSVKRETSPPAKKFATATKDYKSRTTYEKREAYPVKRERDFDADRPHPQSSVSRGPPTTITKYEGSSVFNISRERDMRDARTRDGASSVTNSRISKESRYAERDRDRSPHYRSVRDDRERRTIPEHKAEPRSTREHRYGEPAKVDGQRFERNTGSSWNHLNPSANKVFNPSTPSKNWSKESWRPSESASAPERWNSGNVSRGAASMSAAPFSGNSTINIGPSCPPPPAINSYTGDRFEYKSLSNIRKY